MSEPKAPQGNAAPEPTLPLVADAATAMVDAGLPYLAGAMAPAPLAQSTLQAWQGPLPPPEAMERYEKLQPGAFDRVPGMAEKSQAAQIDSNRHAMDYTQRDIRRGHWLGFAATLAAIAGAVACAGLGHDWVAAALIGVPVMAVARALIDSTRGAARRR